MHMLVGHIKCFLLKLRGSVLCGLIDGLGGRLWPVVGGGVWEGGVVGLVVVVGLGRVSVGRVLFCFVWTVIQESMRIVLNMAMAHEPCTSLA